MNRHILTIVLLLITSSLFGQDSKVKLYYQETNKAELAIVDSSYAKAQGFYKAAFSAKTPEGKDLYNAFLVSIILNDTADARKLVMQLAHGGLKKGFIVADVEFYNRKELFEKISQDYDAIRNDRIAKDKNISYYKTILDSLENVDQAIRTQSTNNDSIKMVDQNNELFIKKMIASRGFPGFKEVGYFPNVNSPSKPNTIWYVAWHRRPSQVIFDDELKEQVKQGNFRPDQYALLQTGQDNDYYHLMLDNDGQPLTTQEKDEINRRRSEINLENLNDYEKKITYSIHHPSRFFFYHHFILMMNRK